MVRYVALLRGVNVGRTKRMAMQELRDLLSAAGLEQVQTLLQSGNALFSAAPQDTAALGAHLENLIAGRFGMEVPCVVCSDAEVIATVAANPFPHRTEESSRLLLTFLSRVPRADELAAHDPNALAPGDIQIMEKVVYQWCPEGVSNAPQVVPYVERHLGVRATARNWATVEKILAALRP